MNKNERAYTYITILSNTLSNVSSFALELVYKYNTLLCAKAKGLGCGFPISAVVAKESVFNNFNDLG